MGFWSGKKRRQVVPSSDSMETVRRSSSLPSGVFKAACDPNIEDALSGPVADVFLDHMSTAVSGSYEVSAVQEQLPKNFVSDEEISAFLLDYANAEHLPPPDVARFLEEERIWVMADLATEGSGRARELATRELREVVGRVSTDQLDVDLLGRLCAAIETHGADSNSSVLLEVLLGAARESLGRIVAEGADA